ncbi:MAG: four helix bundle protein [Opitutales bacterium]|nr:four helix bundle protein [Opitutales bacterium]
MEEVVFSFEKLYAWQDSMRLLKLVYALLEKFPQREQFALSSQLRRAVVSVPSNIAEGNGRFSAKDQLRFFEIAYGSLMEVFCQIKIARELDYISETEQVEAKALILSIAKSLSGLSRHRRQAEQTENSKTF